MSNSIKKNTVYLYLRTLFVLFVNLFTYRVILDCLGVDDFGLYNTIGSVTAFMSFISSALGLATSRFLTYDLGIKDEERCSKTFSNILLLYFIFACVFIAIIEPVGIWYIDSKLVYDISRHSAVLWVFQFSVLTVVISIFTAPLMSMVIANEDMNVFAILGVGQALFQLVIAYCLYITIIDRLILYACLLLFLNIVLFMIYVIYTKRQYPYIKFVFRRDDKTIKDIGGFAGWTTIGTLSTILQVQGINIITNLFFGTAIVAARAISIQVNTAVNNFVSNFRMAVNPQIVKRHAGGDEYSTIELFEKSTILSLVLTLTVCYPLIIYADFILRLWLVEVPEYTVPFVQLILLQSVLMSLENSFYSIFYAQGRVKENSLVSPVVSIIMFGVVYVLFSLGFNPLALSYCYLISTALSSLVIKPYLIIRLFKYPFHIFKRIYLATLKLILVSTPLWFIYCKLKVDSLILVVLNIAIIVIYVAVFSYFFVFDKKLKVSVDIVIKQAINKAQTRWV